jgi:hypothetical protein
MSMSQIADRALGFNRNPQTEETLRAELAQLRTRYDSGAVSHAVAAAIKRLEADIAWAEHRGRS